MTVRNGHTLTEILVVLALTGLVLTVVTPQLRAMKEPQPEELERSVARARRTAIITGTVVRTIIATRSGDSIYAAFQPDGLTLIDSTVAFSTRPVLQ